jgi:hypothetical protein
MASFAPIRSPRQLYKINEITRPGAAGAKIPLLVKIKESVGDFLGLVPVAYDDPIFGGTFGGSGLNQGAKYRKRLGGFRNASYQIVARTQFTVQEIIRQPDGSYTQAPKKVRTISIGFPHGHSVTEVVAWIGGKAIAPQVSAIITPSGHRVPVHPQIT